MNECTGYFLDVLLRDFVLRLEFGESVEVFFFLFRGDLYKFGRYVPIEADVAERVGEWTRFGFLPSEADFFPEVVDRVLVVCESWW